MNAGGSWGFDEGDEIAAGLHAVELLGGGRRYEAYLAWHDDLLALATVKIVRPALVSKPGPLKGLAGEARMLAATDHPNIVRSFGGELDGPRPHLVLEYLDGPRLSTLTRRHGIVLEQLLSLALELCSALHYLSVRKIVHLDVKPRNIIMAASPRLIDLSVAMPLDEVPSIREPIGTDEYMAPEQSLPERSAEIGPATDVWGLGVTLFEALARELPFPSPSERLRGAACSSATPSSRTIRSTSPTPCRPSSPLSFGLASRSGPRTGPEPMSFTRRSSPGWPAR